MLLTYTQGTVYYLTRLTSASPSTLALVDIEPTPLTVSSRQLRRIHPGSQSALPRT